MTSHVASMSYSPEAVGHRLKTTRLSIPAEVANIATALGVDEATYLACEDGKADLGVVELAALRRDFNVDLDWLLIGPGENQSPDAPALNEPRKQYDPVLSAQALDTIARWEQAQGVELTRERRILVAREAVELVRRDNADLAAAFEQISLVEPVRDGLVPKRPWQRPLKLASPIFILTAIASLIWGIQTDSANVATPLWGWAPAIGTVGSLALFAIALGVAAYRRPIPQARELYLVASDTKEFI